MQPSLPPNLEGSIVAERYRVERLLGQGGMGSVWAGRHVTLGQLVAVKFIRPRLATSDEALRRFDNEARAAAAIRSRHAAAVYDHGVTADGQPYIVMEYLEGESLEQRLRREGPLPMEEVARIVGQAARALAVAHEAGIVHRDLKPDNIFLATDRESGKYGYTVKLVDFGIAKILDEEARAGAAATQAGSVLGTPHYMSPEALRESENVTSSTDIWSLSACAFAAATGRVPFPGDSIGDVVLKVCAAPLPVPSQVNPALPKAFDLWFCKGCHRDAQKRFSTVVEMAAALLKLEQWADAQQAVMAYKIRPQQLSQLELELNAEPRRRFGRGSLLAVVLASAAVAVGVLGYVASERARERRLQQITTVPTRESRESAQRERQLREAEARLFGARPVEGSSVSGHGSGD